MTEYAKKWLSLEQQIDRLVARGLRIEDHSHAISVLQAVGYYRLTGYLYPFLESERYIGNDGRERTRLLGRYRPGTALSHAEDIIDFDRHLRLLVLEGVERIEVDIRMQTGYILGRTSAFAYENADCFDSSFTSQSTDSQDPRPSKHVLWLDRVKARRDSSDEQVVSHFRDKYDDRMPIWALTELLELGHLSTLYRGMRQKDAEELAVAFGVPKKKTMTSWLASLNYVRNVAAHHARLFNRKLQNAPSRPPNGTIPMLDHLRAADAPKQDFGTYNALAVIAYLLQSVDPDCGWIKRASDLLKQFPSSHALTVQSLGVPVGWTKLELWNK
ncbi:Abi family protein [Glutamicibacter sp. JC586]|uniref:Abi family protein n=1 Tax=Glutamicibacter sp. JC586 TaxID=2590552 RepID=UPI00135B2A37|nr:Abi family protein [Glutamicibacter sp. JC586]